jgi:hypothetical protein
VELAWGISPNMSPFSTRHHGARGTTQFATGRRRLRTSGTGRGIPCAHPPVQQRYEQQGWQQEFERRFPHSPVREERQELARDMHHWQHGEGEREDDELVRQLDAEYRARLQGIRNRAQERDRAALFAPPPGPPPGFQPRQLDAESSVGSVDEEPAPRRAMPPAIPGYKSEDITFG